jgi:hypothetical protein
LTTWLCRRGAYGGFPILALIGIGGMGKSNLGWVWTKHDIARQELGGLHDQVGDESIVEKGWGLPLKIMWFSFYEHEGGGDFSKFLEKAIVHFSSGTQLPEDYQIEGTTDYQRLTEELQVLLQMPSLIVWDGAERLLLEYHESDGRLNPATLPTSVEQTAQCCSDHRVTRFLWSLSSQTAAKLLILSRLPFADLEHRAGARSEKLKGLDPDSAVRFLRNRGITGAASRLEETARWYEFHPLSISNIAASLQDDFVYKADIRGRLPEGTGLPADSRRQHILEAAYNKRAAQRRALLSRMAAIRGRITQDLIQHLAADIRDISATTLGRDISELVRHGLLRQLNGDGDRYDMHPVIRSYAYARLENAAAVHRILAQVYSDSVSDLDMERIQELSKLDRVINYYYHLARSGRYDDAFELFYRRQLTESTRTGEQDVAHDTSAHDLNGILHFQLGRLDMEIELLKLLFPDGVNSPPAVREEHQPALLNNLGLSYRMIGDPKRAINLFTRCAETVDSLISKNATRCENLEDYHRLRALAHENLANAYLEMGDLKAAEHNIQRSRLLYEQLTWDSGDHVALGTVMLDAFESKIEQFRGDFDRGRDLLVRAFTLLKEHKRLKHIVAFVAVEVALLEVRAANPAKALELMKQLDAEFKSDERQSIYCTFACGAAALRLGNLTESSGYLDKALLACRRMALVEVEPKILLEIAKLERAKKSFPEAARVAKEAGAIAEGNGYNFQSADIDNFVAGLLLESGKKSEARRYAAQAQSAALSGRESPKKGYYYVAAYDEAERLLAQCEPSSGGLQPPV